MEIRTGTPVKKWDDVNGATADVSKEIVVTDAGIKLPQEMDPNIIGNVRRGLEDQLEQNDNMIGDGVINNIDPEKNKELGVIDDNANGIPDEIEKESLLKQLHEHKPVIAPVPKDEPLAREEKVTQRLFTPELVL